MRFLLVTIYIFTSNLVVGQEKVFQFLVQYPSNVDEITLEESNNIQITIDSLKSNSTILSIEISSHTDSVGSFEFNQDLSNRRAAGVAAHLIQNCGIETQQITQNFHGFSKPIGKGDVNRRTEILVKYMDLTLEDEIFKLYAMLKQSPEEFWINPQKDTVLISKNGVLYAFEEKAFLGSRKLKITIEEHFEISDMLMHQLTTTSQGKFLETGGMFNVQAFDEKGKKIQMRKGKNYWTFIPNQLAPNPYQMFDGHFDQDSIIDWTPEGQFLSNMNGRVFGQCRFGDGTNQNCPLFFCKIRKWFGNEDNSPLPPSMTSNVIGEWNPCSIIESLRASLGIQSLDFVLKNLDSILLASFGVSSIEEYIEILRLQRQNEIEQALESGAEVTDNDISFFISQSGNLNWRNIDYFLNVQRPISIKINTNQTLSTRCFMVFKKQQVIIPLPVGGGNYFELKAAPENTDAFLVIFQYSKGQPAMVIQEINTNDQNFYLVPELVSVKELKERLKSLDNGRKPLLANWQ